MIYLNLHKTSAWNNFQTNNKPIMKKFLTLLVVSALTVGGLRAQVENTPVCLNGYIQLMVPQLVNNNQSVFYNIEYKESTVGKCTIYNKNLRVLEEFNLPRGLQYMYYLNPLENVDEDEICLSQSLFNSDDNFEFISPIESTISGTEIHLNNGFVLKNDKGETLQTVYFPNNMVGSDTYPRFMDLGDVKYLVIDVYNSQYESYTLFYSVNGDGSNILSLACPPMRVQARPTVAGASEPVTVTFDSSNVSRIEVVSVKGSVAGTFVVTPGEHSATIDTSRLGKGMYIINVVENGTRSENCKIIIR